MENENFTAYDLEREDPRDPGVSEIPQTPHVKVIAEDAHPSADSENTDLSDQPGKDQPDDARREIDSMIEEMGAGKVLEIIRDNRNAAIRQIMKEMSEEADCPLHSGVSNEISCQSIFDLASLA